MIDFAWPWLFLVLPAPWVVRHLIPPASSAQGAALKIPFFRDVLSLGWKGDRGNVRYLDRWIVWIAWLALVSAAARPELVGDAVPLPVGGRDLVLAIDISGSMAQLDFSPDGERTSRLGVVKSIAGDFIERRSGDRIGLVLFGSRAYVQTPLTFDRTTVTLMLKDAAIGLAGKQTAIGDAIGLTLKRLRKSKNAERVLVLLTDGANTGGTMAPVRAAELSASEGLRIYTIGIGAQSIDVDENSGAQSITPASDLDENTLFAIADLTGGAYFRAGDSESLEKIYQRLDELEPTKDVQSVFRPTLTLYPWPLSVALLISIVICVRRLPWFLVYRRWRVQRSSITATRYE